MHAEALHAAGQQERARAAIATARDRLLANAEKIGDPTYRKSFLENVPENARTVELAREWLGGDPAAREAPIDLERQELAALEHIARRTPLR
jgi:hypothetical protein